MVGNKITEREVKYWNKVFQYGMQINKNMDKLKSIKEQIDELPSDDSLLDSELKDELNMTIKTLFILVSTQSFCIGCVAQMNPNFANN